VGLVGWLVTWLLERFVNLSFSLVIFLGITYAIIVSPSCEEWGPGGRAGGLNAPSQRHSFSTFSSIWRLLVRLIITFVQKQKNGEGWGGGGTEGVNLRPWHVVLG